MCIYMATKRTSQFSIAKAVIYPESLLLTSSLIFHLLTGTWQCEEISPQPPCWAKAASTLKAASSPCIIEKPFGALAGWH